MLALCATDHDDDDWMTESVAPLVRTVTVLALRMLRELVVRPRAEISFLDEGPAPLAEEIREIVVARGVEVRSPTRLLRWHHGPAAQAPERPRRA